MELKPIYLDNNATTREAPAVVEAMLPFSPSITWQCSSIHAFGSEAGKAPQEGARGSGAARRRSTIWRSSFTSPRN